MPNSTNSVYDDIERARSWQGMESGQVDLSELTWEQKEQVLRSVPVCVCVCMFLFFLCTYVCGCVSLRVSVCVSLCVCVCVCPCVYVCVPVCVCVSLCVYVRMCLYVCVCWVFMMDTSVSINSSCGDLYVTPFPKPAVGYCLLKWMAREAFPNWVQNQKELNWKQL